MRYFGGFFAVEVVHCGLLPTMCRVRFGLTGIYFEPLEPSRPREESLQPLIAAIPPEAQNKRGDIVPETIDNEGSEAKVGKATGIAKKDEDGTTISPSDSSSSSSSKDEQSRRLAKNTKTNYASVGSKRVRSSSASSSSSSSSSSTSSPPSSDEDQGHKSANTKTRVQVAKPVNSHTTRKCDDKPSKRQTSRSLRGLTKGPPAKRVRFAMDVQEKILPSGDASDTSSSHSSDDSYTDPPSPTEPYDAFAGYYRTPGASRSHRRNGHGVRSGIRFPAEEDMNTDGADGFLVSEDGSEVDVQGLPVKGRLPRTVRAAGKSQSLDQRHHQSSSTPLARSKHSGRVMEQSRVMAGGLERNVDGGLRLEQSHASERQSASPLRSGAQLRYPKLRSGKILPEPIFVVRPRFLSDAEEKGKPAYMLSSSGHGRGMSKNGNEGTKTSLPRPARVKASKQDKTSKYQYPSVSDDLKEDAEFDEDLGLLVRDV